MPADSIVLQHGLPEAHFARAAAIYYAAFGRKYRLLFDEAQALVLFPRLFDPTHAIVALDGGQLVGVAGLHYEGSGFVCWRWPAYRETFGLIGGAHRALWMRLDSEHPPAGELLLEALAVDPARRGQGIGSRLLAETCAFARARGYRAVRLSVVDTNPRARALYEREGFQPVRTIHVPGMQWAAGFGAFTKMRKPVDDA